MATAVNRKPVNRNHKRLAGQKQSTEEMDLKALGLKIKKAIEHVTGSEVVMRGPFRPDLCTLGTVVQVGSAVGSASAVKAIERNRDSVFTILGNIDSQLQELTAQSMRIRDHVVAALRFRMERTEPRHQYQPIFGAGWKFSASASRS